jgi:hypothetical protein
MWHATVLDIESTLRLVCKKTFKDASVSKEVRVRRVEAVLILGQIFQATVSEEGDFDLNDFKKKFGQPGGPGDFGGGEESEEAPDAPEAQEAPDAQEKEAQPLTQEQLLALPAAELKRMLQQKGIDFSDCVEKADYVQRALDAQKQR